MSNEEQARRKRLPWKDLIIGAIALIGIGYFAFNHIRNARIEASTVVARVNGESISAADVNRGFSSDSFASTVNATKEEKLSRLIAQVAVRQFLSKHGIKVNEKLVDNEIRRMEKTPPSMGCPCCTYESLDAYLVTIGYTRKNLRQDIRNSIGLSEYARKSWKKSHPDKADALKEIGEQADYVRKHYVKAWQIFFNTFQKAGFDTNPGPIRKALRKKAQNAWERLQKGESFGSVARSVSEDMTSKNKGGSLGMIDKSSYGREFEDTISSLKPGEYSKPFESPWGFHIVRREPTRDEDIITFCESYLAQKEYQRLYDQIVKEAKVERAQADNTDD